jgi:hypothetical protein
MSKSAARDRNMVAERSEADIYLAPSKFTEGSSSAFARVSLLLEDFSRHPNRCDGTRPPGVERQMCDCLDQLLLRHAISTRSGEMRSKLIGTVHRGEQFHVRPFTIH